MEELSRVKKMSLGLFVFLLGVSIPFDVLGAVPFLGVIITFLFILIVKLQLIMHGYHAGIWRMVAIFLVFLLLEFIFTIWPSNFLYVVSFYIFNHWSYNIAQKRLSEEGQAA